MAPAALADAVADWSSISLIACDGVPVTASRAAAAHCSALGPLLADKELASATPVPVPGVRGKHLRAVIAFCESLAAAAAAPAPASAHAAFATTFATDADARTLLGRTLASHYLGADAALDACVAAVAGRLRGASPEGIRSEFDVPADLTPAEQASIRETCVWAFD